MAIFRKGRRMRRGYGRKKSVVKKGIRKARSQAFRKKVLSVIHRVAENKKNVFYAANQSMICAQGNIPFNINLVPPLSQGTGAAQRIGNVVNVRRASLKGYVNMLPYNATTNPTVGPVYVKMWLFSVKNMTNSGTLSSSSIGSNFFDTGGSSTGFQNNTLDLVLPVNSQLITLYKTKTVLLSAGATQGSTYYNAAGGSCGSNGRFSAPFSFSYGKLMKVLKFDDTSPTQPTNRNLWLACQPVYADGTSVAGGTFTECHYTHVVEYEDM